MSSEAALDINPQSMQYCYLKSIVPIKLSPWPYAVLMDTKY